MTEPTHNTLAWHGGKISPVKDLYVSVEDASLEHGLGLFESIRAENGRVPLLARHLERIEKSAVELGLGLDIQQLPDQDTISELLAKSGLTKGSARLRLVLTGGARGEAGQVWITAHALGQFECDNLKLSSEFWPVDERDVLVRYKTLNYWLRRRAYEEALVQGCHEMLSQDSRGNLWEGARSALFLVSNGNLMAPLADGPMLASIAAEVVRELANEVGISLISKTLRESDVLGADEIILANAVRGVMSVGPFGHSRCATPGPVALSLRKIWQNRYF
ncbi:MAG: aminotransferase class IV [bacterium]